MTNLTPSEARRLIDKLHHNQTKEHGISILEEKYLAALVKALPVLDGKVQVIPDGWKLVPETLSPEMLRGIVPNMAHSQPISHDEYDYKGRNERFVKWIWSRLLEVSPPPPQPKTDTYRQIENDVWIEWRGGECPIELPRQEVEYLTRLGNKHITPAGDLRWYHEGKGGDIIAYRIIDTNQNGEQ